LLLVVSFTSSNNERQRRRTRAPGPRVRCHQARHFLVAHDGYEYVDSLRDPIRTGPTRTHVDDQGRSDDTRRHRKRRRASDQTEAASLAD
jgi:hypothetical protein